MGANAVKINDRRGLKCNDGIQISQRGLSMRMPESQETAESSLLSGHDAKFNSSQRSSQASQACSNKLRKLTVARNCGCGSTRAARRPCRRLGSAAAGLGSRVSSLPSASSLRS